MATDVQGLINTGKVAELERKGVYGGDRWRPYHRRLRP